ncbi:MAG: hypothetical protein AB8I08_08305 [Sandaracinaceae bacterium]
MFAVVAPSTQRLEWLPAEVERDFEPGEVGPPRASDGIAPVLREPVGMRGRFGAQIRFEDHASCDYASRMEILRRGQRHRFTWSGLYAFSFGVLVLGRHTYFAESAYGRWSLTPLSSRASHALAEPRIPTYVGADFDHVEMEIWYCMST